MVRVKHQNPSLVEDLLPDTLGMPKELWEKAQANSFTLTTHLGLLKLTFIRYGSNSFLGQVADWLMAGDMAALKTIPGLKFHPRTWSRRMPMPAEELSMP